MDLAEHLQTRKAYLETARNYDSHFDLAPVIQETLQLKGFHEKEDLSDERFYLDNNQELCFIITPPRENFDALIPSNYKGFGIYDKKVESYTLINLSGHEWESFLGEYKDFRREEVKNKRLQGISAAGTGIGLILSIGAGMILAQYVGRKLGWEPNSFRDMASTMLSGLTFGMPTGFMLFRLCDKLSSEDCQLKERFMEYNPKFNYEALDELVQV